LSGRVEEGARIAVLPHSSPLGGSHPTWRRGLKSVPGNRIGAERRLVFKEQRQNRRHQFNRGVVVCEGSDGLACLFVSSPCVMREKMDRKPGRFQIAKRRGSES
jgi:hypothetical protein